MPAIPPVPELARRSLMNLLDGSLLLDLTTLEELVAAAASVHPERRDIARNWFHKRHNGTGEFELLRQEALVQKWTKSDWHTAVKRWRSDPAARAFCDRVYAILKDSKVDDLMAWISEGGCPFEEEAFEHVVEKTTNYIASLARISGVWDDEEIQDLVNRVHFRLYKSLRKGKYQPQSRSCAFGYIKETTRQELYDYRDRRRKDSRFLPMANEQFLGEEDERRSLDTLAGSELREEVEAVFAKLPEEEQVLLRAKYWEGYSPSQIAEGLGMEYRAVLKKLCTAKEHFAQLWGSQGGFTK